MAKNAKEQRREKHASLKESQKLGRTVRTPCRVHGKGGIGKSLGEGPVGHLERGERN